MPTLRVALGSLTLALLLQSCASAPPPDPLHRLSLTKTTASTEQSECPPLFGKVCYGTVPGAMKCGCSTASPLGTPYW
jgi:hypothetical protein